MAEERPSASDIRANTESIYTNIAAIREEIDGIGATAEAHTYSAERDGLVFGKGKDQLYSGANEWEAPKKHPVWADELRHETDVLRQMGEAGSQHAKPWEIDPDSWPSASMLEKYHEHEEHSMRHTSMYENDTAQDQRAMQAQQRREAAVQLHAFEGKTPGEQQQAYIQQVTQDAIRTGVEEGYPIRDHAQLARHVTAQATPENVQTHIAGLRQEAGMGKAESPQEKRMEAGQEERGAREPTPEQVHRWQAMQQIRQGFNTQQLANARPAWERGADTERSR